MAALYPAAEWPWPGTHSNVCCESGLFCLQLACVLAGVRGAAYQTTHAAEVPETARLQASA